MAIFETRISREGQPVHEVLRPPQQPDVLAAGAELLLQLKNLQQSLVSRTHPYAGTDSVFVGHIQAGEIYNQSPTECILQGTRRWVTPNTFEEIKLEFNQILEELAKTSCTSVKVNFEVQGDAFSISPDDPIIAAFQNAHQAVTGNTLSFGNKPFVDDGNSFSSVANIPALTHGPNATGAHTLEECVPVAELVRVAQVYALTAAGYCISK